MSPLIILKIGGSVATYKDRPGLAIRTSLLRSIAHAIKQARSKQAFRLILIHGSGSAGHTLAHEFDLGNGTGTDPQKKEAALRSQRANQKLNAAIADICVTLGLPVVPVHTASIVLQRNKTLHHVSTETIAHALVHDHIPLLYGEMVPDTTLGFTVCSGDTIATFLAKTFGAERVCFASDIDGIFTRDPHRFPDATLLSETTLTTLTQQSELSGSHNVDVTGGLGGKIHKLALLRRSTVERIEIFNGLRAKNYQRVLLSLPFPHTTIFLSQKKRG